MNKVTITKNNLASIVLLYNYLITNQYSVPKSVVDNVYKQYTDNFNTQFKDKYNFIDEDIKEDDFSKNNLFISNALYNYYYRNNSYKSPYRTFEKDYIGIQNGDTYRIIDLNAIVLNYRSLPIEIVDYSLSNEVLNNLDLELNKLDQDIVVKEYDQYLDVYSLNQNYALELAKKKINDSGYYDVKIGNIIYLGKNSHIYRIFYDAKKDYKRVKVPQMILKR